MHLQLTIQQEIKYDYETSENNGKRTDDVTTNITTDNNTNIEQRRRYPERKRNKPKYLEEDYVDICCKASCIPLPNTYLQAINSEESTCYGKRNEFVNRK